MKAKSHSDQLHVEKAIWDRETKSYQSKLHEAQLRLDDASRNLADLEVARNKLSSENSSLERKYEQSEQQVGALQKLRISLETQLADAVKLAEDESKDRMQLLSKFRYIEAELDAVRQHLDEVMQEKEDLMRQLSKANGDAAFWRSK